MKKEKKTGIILILTIVLLALLLIGGNIAYKILAKNVQEQQITKQESSKNEVNMEEESEATTEESLAMDFTVYDKDGKEVRLSDFRGEKPVVVNFWASWCPPCKEEMPYFQEAINKYGDEVEILMVNLTDGERETIEKADEFIKESGYEMNVLYDLDFNATNTYLLYSIPRTLFITKDGALYYDHMGMISEEILNSNIEKIIEQ